MENRIKLYIIASFSFLLTFSSCSQVTWPCFCGCSSAKYLSILNEPIDQNRLASVHVNAPDPLHELNLHGQRLYISWNLPKKYSESQLSGLLKIRFHCSEQVSIPFAIRKLKGNYIYEITNREYFSKEGILAYKVQIFSMGKEVDCYQHVMWNELVAHD